MFLPSEDILKNLSEIMHPYAFVFAGTLALKNNLTCISVTPVFNRSCCFLTSNTIIGNKVLESWEVDLCSTNQRVYTIIFFLKTIKHVV